MANMSNREFFAEIIKNAGRPLNYSEIADAWNTATLEYNGGDDFGTVDNSDVGGYVASLINTNKWANIVKTQENGRPVISWDPDAVGFDTVEINGQTTSRSQIESETRKTWSSMEKLRETMMRTVANELKNITSGVVNLHIDHAKSISNHGAEAHNPDNFHLLDSRVNIIKSDNDWPRFTIEEQIEHINSILAIVPKNIEYDKNSVQMLLDTLRIYY